MSRQELYINLGLLAAILLLAGLIVTLEPEVHVASYSKESIDKLEQVVLAQAALPDESQSNPLPGARRRDVASQYPSYFAQTLFEPLIPTPTPTPTPSPTPEPTPDLAQALADRWKLAYVMGSELGFMDTQSNEFIEMKVGESRSITWGRFTLDVRVVSVDEGNQAATVESYGQTLVLRAF